MDKSTASSTNVEFEIVHAVKGRVRLRLKRGDARELLPRIAHHLRQQAGILRVEIKPTSKSFLVIFDPDIISIEQLTDSLQSFGSSATANIAIAQSTGESQAITYSRLFSLVPPLVGLGIARGLQVSGWKSILTYILAAGVTREVIDQVKGESEESENDELSPAKKVSTTEVAAEEILTFLTAIETDYEIVHQIPGRIRLRVPRISRDRNYGQELKHLLEQDNRIIDVRLKTNSSSVVILYDPEVFSDSNRKNIALNESNGQVDRSESSIIPNPKKSATESEPNNTPPPNDETSSESKILTSETDTDTRDTLDTEAESTTPILPDESETKTNQEFTNGETIANCGYWSDFKSSMLLTMLELMGNLQMQRVDI